ncbi:DUF4153 domain-containing protein [Paractinoplanes rishiriensis]|uniref:DUF4153 domain-containing protein n=1 Tax=Paractinoplanes rishiriensis TaxID=1050105 RepID=UPI001EF1C63B|nr:DUF4173 domain-containing protein [Actinoplanes rishiriensis]
MPGRVTLVAIGVAAAVAAVSLPLDRAGVGWLVTAVAGTVALVVAKALDTGTAAGVPAPLVVRGAAGGSADRFGWAAATVVLLGVGTVRAAEWLFVLCLLTATLTASLALAGGRSLRGIAAGYTMPPLAAFRAMPWLSRGAQRVRGRAGSVANVRVVATIATSVALLTVFGGLFASADAAFADALSRIVPDVNVGTAVRWVFVGTVTVLALGGAAFLRAAPPDLSGLDAAAGRRVNRYEWAVPLSLLVLLFAAFVTVQLTVLFGGNRHVLETDGLTYADYARGGFWQLSFATGLTLVVLAGAARWAPRDRPADRVLIRVLLGALAALTLVIVGSALQRMDLYADTYGLTRLRLLVALCEGWFGLVLLLVLGAGIQLRAPWLPRVAIAAGVLALLGLSAANPDRMIAEHNIRQDRAVDLIYLGNLSPDAVPAFDALDPERRDCLYTRVGLRLDEYPDDWRGWNLGRDRARTIIANDLYTPNWRCS